MLWYWATALAFSASAAAHATHHAHDQKTFSQERLDELERKWGTDVSSSLRFVYEQQLIRYSGVLVAYQRLLTYHTRAASHIRKLHTT
jgi:hypothetical protein